MPDAFDPAAINDAATTAAQLRAHVAAITRLTEERKALGEALASRYAAAASEGFDKTVLKTVVKRLDIDQGELALADDTLRLYESWLRGENPDDAAMLHRLSVEVGRGGRSRRTDH
jgi:uncharacterized protein (UPF0335 family)